MIRAIWRADFERRILHITKNKINALKSKSPFYRVIVRFFRAYRKISGKWTSQQIFSDILSSVDTNKTTAPISITLQKPALNPNKPLPFELDTSTADWTLLSFEYPPFEMKFFRVELGGGRLA